MVSSPLDIEQKGPVRRPVVLTGTALAVVCFQTLGVIYSDIGTSPLYVLNGIWPSSGPAPSKEDVIGGISAIFWALTILPLLKYIVITLQFGTIEGEGGTFALYNGLYPPSEPEDDDRTLTSESGIVKSHRSGRRSLLQKMRWAFLPWALFGTALTLSDGVFTPAVSVTSAVGGIAIAKPNVASNIQAIAIAFLVGLFLVQRFGTSRLTAVFAPVTFGWLALIAATGIANITKYPGVFRAIDPSRAIMWFVRTGEYDYLAGVLLAVTGCEALFANLGQFNAKSIQLSFTFFVYPCLVLAYLGQGARVIVDGDAVMSNIFFQTIPGKAGGPLYWIVYVFSILATLIASQAMITGTFSLVQQLINMKSVPPLRMIYTSSTIQGQVYVPTANYLLGAGCLIIVGVFKNLANMTNAYGFAVATVMFVTTTFIAVQIVIIKGKPIILAIAFLIFFGFFDGIFWGASLRKIPHGAWVPLAIGAVLTILMCFWTWAKSLEDKFDGQNRKNPRHFIVPSHMLGSLSHSKKSSNVNINVPSTTTAIRSTPIKSLVNEMSSDVTDLHGALDHVAELPSNMRGRHAVQLDIHPQIEEGDEDDENDEVYKKNGSLTFVDEDGEAKHQLVRLPTCSIFHKPGAGKGVPHTFFAFIRQYPALPRVVIFLSVRVVPVAYIDPSGRYVVTKVRSIPGFYGVVYRIGFRDTFEPSTTDIIEHVCAIETRADPRNATRVVQEIRAAANSSSHIIPHYVVISRSSPHPGLFRRIIEPVRRYLIENIYQRLATMFPETANWDLDNEDILRVGVNARV